MDPELERRLREWHDDGRCSEEWDSQACSGDCVTMRELREGATIGVMMAATCVSSWLGSPSTGDSLRGLVGKGKP